MMGHAGQKWHTCRPTVGGIVEFSFYGFRKPTEAHRGTRKPIVIMDEHRQ